MSDLKVSCSRCGLKLLEVNPTRIMVASDVEVEIFDNLFLTCPRCGGEEEVDVDELRRINVPDYVKLITNSTVRTQEEGEIITDIVEIIQPKEINYQHVDGVHCDICGRKLVDLSDHLKGISAHVCAKHGIRPIAVVKGIIGSELINKLIDEKKHRKLQKYL